MINNIIFFEHNIYKGFVIINKNKLFLNLNFFEFKLNI